MKKRFTIFIGIGLTVAAAAIAGTTAYLDSAKRARTEVFAQQAMLAQLWDSSKKDQIEAGSGRTLDRSADNITTSEGQSYSLLRAVWSDDRTTFDQSLKWTKDNLQREDGLFSWRYGKQADGSYGILTDIGGQNTASDADTDIALALVMASQRWHDAKYLDEARTVIGGIWQHEVVMVAGKPVLTANQLEKNNKTQVLVNPSYFAPYAYKVFAKIDRTHDWTGLRDNSYTVLSDSITADLDKSSGRLAPNWIVMNRQTGTISAASGTNIDSNYGYDAMRVPFRLALDYAWYKDPRDKSVLKSMSALGENWANNRFLASVYAHDNDVVAANEAPAMYGGAIGYFQVVNPGQSREVYDQKLASLYDPNAQTWRSQLNYYDDNWAWFGLALYSRTLTNLTNVK